jgi:hypothetical protein
VWEWSSYLSGFLIYKKWATDLQGKVMSQPIVVDGYIYVQAGKDLVKVKLEDGQIAIIKIYI